MSIIHHHKTRTLVPYKARRLTATVTVLAVVAVALGLSTTSALATVRPVKEIVKTHIGWEANKTTGSTICPVEPGIECQPGKPSTKPGAFHYIQGLAVNNDPVSPHYGHVYVFDKATPRIQELTATGQFVSMIGKEVDETTHGNICTAASGDTCGPGVRGTAPGQLSTPWGIAIDSKTGNIYVADIIVGSGGRGHRIQELTPEGQFVLEVGREVNETTKANRCTQEEIETKGVKCTEPAPTTTPTVEHEAFAFQQYTNPVTIGGPEDVIYVGEPGRVQELRPDGEYKTELKLKDKEVVQSIAVDENGTVFVAPSTEEAGGQVGSRGDVVERFDASGNETAQFQIAPEHTSTRSVIAEVQVLAIAVDPYGRLAVVEVEPHPAPEPIYRTVAHRGMLYNADGSRLRFVSEFADPVLVGDDSDEGLSSLAFNGQDELYGAFNEYYNLSTKPYETNEVIAYAPVNIGELLTGGTDCVEGVESGSDATLNCTLHGEANPWGVSGTEVWFDWGYDPGFGNQAGVQTVGEDETPVVLTAPRLDGLVPNANLYYRVAGHDANVQAPEELLGETMIAKLPKVPPRIVGVPVVQFLHQSSAVMYGLVNPENTQSEYFFEYAPGEQTLAQECPNGVRKETCNGVQSTSVLESNGYRNVGGTFEVTGLRPGTVYHYRLAAVNEAGETAVDQTGGKNLPEGEFETAALPSLDAVTGQASMVDATSATVSGMIDPGGRPAVYAFELGIYNPDGTVYGTVLSAQAGAGSEMVSESTSLTGLQPGTVYAYRISVWSAYGTSYGQPVLFQTQGLPAVIGVPGVLPLLAVPNIQMPSTVGVTPRHVIKKKKKRKSRKGKHDAGRGKPRLHKHHKPGKGKH